MAQTITRTFPDGDYPSRLNRAFAAYEAALKDDEKGRGTDLLAGERPASEILREEYEALRQEAELDAVDKRRIVTLRALGRSKWRELRAKYPPRVGDDIDEETVKGDRAAGVNTEAVEDDLLFAAIIEPKFTSRGDYDEWADELAEGEFQMLLVDAWRLVNVASVDPKSLPSSTTPSGGTN